MSSEDKGSNLDKANLNGKEIITIQMLSDDSSVSTASLDLKISDKKLPVEDLAIIFSQCPYLERPQEFYENLENVRISMAGDIPMGLMGTLDYSRTRKSLNGKIRRKINGLIDKKERVSLVILFLEGFKCSSEAKDIDVNNLIENMELSAEASFILIQRETEEENGKLFDIEIKGERFRVFRMSYGEVFNLSKSS